MAAHPQTACYVPDMDRNALVQITECGPDGFRRNTHRIELYWVLKLAEGKVPAIQLEQLKYDIAATGLGVMRGDFGRWFEYQIVDNDQAG